ncbi:MAG: nucleoside 2-deoxyribosyltransferase [Clostridia bacterium]|nr:nucleoside 2-deoxyribosyltransferase [Clostridia bacterium]
MKIYLASPFFSENELSTVRECEDILQALGHEVYSPRLHEASGEKGTPVWSKETFSLNKKAIDASDVLVVLYWGNFSDTGTAWECGYAYGKGLPSVVVHLGSDSNLMIHEGTRSNIVDGTDGLRAFDFEKLPKYGYDGKMF